MDTDKESERNVAVRYETVFCIFMVVAVYLWRENPNFTYPYILYFFLLLLVGNLAAGLSLKAWPTRDWVSALFILGNCATITGIMAFSGGAETNLWVLYLLPINTACLLLGPRETRLITAGAVAFNLGFHAFYSGRWDAGAAFIQGLKTGIFILNAVLTSRLASRDRIAELRLARKRRELDRLSTLLDGERGKSSESRHLAELGLMSSGLTHDLRNNLSVLMAFMEMFSENASLGETMRNDIRRMQGVLNRAKQIMDNFMDHAKKKDVPLVLCDIGLSLDAALETLNTRIEGAGIRVSRSQCADLPRVLAEPPQLERLFLNLLSNAIQAMKGPGEISIRAAIDGEPSRPGLSVVIEDSGPGIPEEMLGRLFKAFSTSRSSEGGTGLGLYICWEIVHRFKGDLLAENRSEGGARFIVRLPAAMPAPYLGSGKIPAAC